jgi:hypothetical protein
MRKIMPLKKEGVYQAVQFYKTGIRSRTQTILQFDPLKEFQKSKK